MARIDSAFHDTKREDGSTNGQLQAVSPEEDCHASC